MNELEKVIAQYQDKLNDVTNNYQQKIGILENKIIDKEMAKDYVNGDEEDYLSDSQDLNDQPPSPTRTLQRSSLASSAKSIDVIREEEDEDEDDVLIELHKKMTNT